MSIINQTVTPDCFGKHWDGKSTDCEGGVDPTHTDARGGHVKEPCRFKTSCSIKSQAFRQVTSNVVPAQNLIRPPQAPPASTYQPQPVTRPWGREVSPPGPNYSAYHSPPAYPTRIDTHSPYGLPQFLPVREPSTTPRGKRFMVEVLRSLAISFGHTIANFFGNESFTDERNERR